MLAALILLSTAAVAKEVFVAPNGSDQNPGSRSRPFGTIERALMEAAKRADDSKIAIRLRGGTYYLSAPLLVGPGHGQLTITPVGKEKATISGGIRLTDWKRSGERWIAKVPGAVIANQLFVDGVRYRRPRLPKSGYFAIENIVNEGDRSKTGDESILFRGQDMNPAWHDQGSVEVLLFQNWTITRLPVKKIDAAMHRADFAGATLGAPWALLKPGGRYLVENVREALSEPGEFYFDRTTREITVIPLTGKDLSKAEVIVPVLERLAIIGDLSKAGVTRVDFRDIRFAHTAWTMPPTGRNFPQAEVDLPGAILVQNAQAVLFDRCHISQTGGYGLEIGDRAQDVGFEDGSITDLGAGGVKIGIMETREDEGTVTRHNQIKDNLIAGGGRVHPAAVGVWIGQSHHNRIEGNEIADFYYTGVSVGWTWGYGRSNAHHNLVKGNHIHQIGQGVLSDMGGVYHLGTAPGTEISGNRIHDVTSFDYGGWGLYTDEGSTGVQMEDNIVYRCSRQSFHQHYGRDNFIRRNILVFAGESQLARTRNEEHRSFTFEQNIVVWKGTPLLWGNWDGDQTRAALDRNLYWRTDGEPVAFGPQSLSEWQRRGRDLGSIVADPLFVDAAKDDFRFKPNSPAIKLGFKPMDPRGRPWKSRWISAAPSFPIK